MRGLSGAGWAGALCALTVPVLAQEPREVRLRALSEAEVEQASGPVDSLIRSGELRVRQIQEDTLLPGRRHQRLAQTYRGVPVWGAEIVRQIDGQDRVVSIFGAYHSGIALDVTPRLAPDEARAALTAAGARPVSSVAPTLAILPGRGEYRLVWAMVGYTRGDVRRYFVDARVGGVVRHDSLLKRQTASVGRGTGVLNNTQKLSVTSTGADFFAQDLLRPGLISTFDMKGDPNRTFAAVLGMVALDAADYARDADNNWTDGPTVDAHAYMGFVYDYFFKRHGRRAWNGADGPIRGLVNPVRIEDLDGYVASGEIFGDIQFLYPNAFFCCGGDLLGLGGFMVYGQGLPASNPFGLPPVMPLAGALDIVAHEMTHGMTAFTSVLDANLEAAALNESFSDQMGIAADFFFNPNANYRLGEQVWPGGNRDMANPALFGDADHLATLRDENFEEHSLASLSNHAYYLAIEGGANRTSGISVQGVGAANRGQIEKVFYRAYQFMLGPDALYCEAVAASILSARELHGAGSRAEQAVVQAWTAVGLFDFCF